MQSLNNTLSWLYLGAVLFGLTGIERVRADAPPPIVVTNSFSFPVQLNQLLYPTNFMRAKIPGTNTIFIVHTNGTTTTYVAAVNSALGRGQALVNAMEDPSLRDGDVFFLSPGLYQTSGTTNQGLAAAPIDLTSDRGTLCAGSHLVGAGKGVTTVDMGTNLVFMGELSCIRDITLTNCGTLIDCALTTTVVPTNLYVLFLNTEIDQPTNVIDVFITKNNLLNLWLENCTFRFTYDVFAASIPPLVDSVLVSHNCSYIANAADNYPITRVQYGCMKRTCYVNGDTISCTGAVDYNIGVDNSDTGKTNSTVNVWNTTSIVSGKGILMPFSNGSWTNNAMFIGPGCNYVKPQVTPQPTYAGTFIGDGSGLTNIAGVFSMQAVNLRGCTTATNLLVYTPPGGSTNSYEVGGYINVTAIHKDVAQAQVAFTDDNGVKQTFFLTSAGVKKKGFSPVPAQQIRVMGGAPITVSIQLTTSSGSIKYDAGANLRILH